MAPGPTLADPSLSAGAGMALEAREAWGRMTTKAAALNTITATTNGATGTASNLDPLKSPLRTPTWASTKARKGTLANPELKVAPISNSNLNVAPATTVTPPTPTDSQVTPFDSIPPVAAAPAVKPIVVVRRDRSSSITNPPSKLSQSMTLPLTPTVEGRETPTTPKSGADVDTQPAAPSNTSSSHSNENNTGQGGFFQTMFSAAQNAAATLGNTVANNITKADSRNASGANTPDAARSRSGTETENKSNASGQDSQSEGPPRKRLAVETLGYGELSLGSLGILPNPSKTELAKGGSSAGTAGANDSQLHISDFDGGHTSATVVGQVEDPFRYTGGMRGGSDKGSFESATQQTGPPLQVILPPKTPMAEDAAFNVAPSGLMSPGYENTTPNGSHEREDWIPTGESGIKRSPSARSNRANILHGHVRRHRGSSAASSMINNLSSLQPPVSPAGSSGPKITGFAVASKKRNREFHALFRSVPEDDYLIEDYGCALQKDILLQGRLYVSEGHICFNSNILGWINTLVISFDEVMAIEKKSTALLFPNAIVIQTLHARNVFASFISRDTTYDLLVNIWKISHPGLIPSVAGFILEKQPDNKGAGSAGKGDYSGSESEDEYDEDEEGYEDDDEEDDGESAADDRAEGGYGELAGGGGSAPNGAAMNASSLEHGPKADAAGAVSDAAGASGNGAADAAKTQSFPGPATHAATDCDDHDLHYDKIVCDEYLPGPLGQVYSLLFGAESYAFLTKYLEEQKWVVNPEAGGKKTRGYSYIRPLPGSIGPKQTKCICTEQIEQLDLEKCVSVLVTTQTPDVPSGNQFCVKTRYCLMWGDGSMTGAPAETRVLLSCTVEWSGKSWLKGPIEKGANDGQLSHGRDLSAALKRELEKTAAALAASRPRGKQGKGKKGRGKNAPVIAVAQTTAALKAAREKQAREKEEKENAKWGLLLPLKPVLSPLVDNLPTEALWVLGLLSLLLVFFCFTGRLPFFGGRSQNGKGQGSGRGMHNAPMAGGTRGGYVQWEQSWYAEEQGLWDWLEDRVGLNTANMAGVPISAQDERRAESWAKLNKQERKRMESIIDAIGGTSDKEVEEAVKVMERRLEVLKGIVDEKKREKVVEKKERQHDNVVREKSEGSESGTAAAGIA
ncbi:hypothetical protein DFH27DRAFT_591107 [Peziza echinospora]|nr:hypothetical protein DFH27DRAFT_591107 [Peziza echinospora]